MWGVTCSKPINEVIFFRLRDKNISEDWFQLCYNKMFVVVLWFQHHFYVTNRYWTSIMYRQWPQWSAIFINMTQNSPLGEQEIYVQKRKKCKALKDVCFEQTWWYINLLIFWHFSGGKISFLLEQSGQNLREMAFYLDL